MNINDFRTDSDGAAGTHGDAGHASNAGEDFTPDAGSDLSLGGFDAGMDGSGGRPRFNSGAALLVIVVVAAIVGLYSMRTLTRATAASTSKATELEKSIETFINTVTGQRSASSATGQGAGGGVSLEPAEGVLNVLSGSYAERQVPLENVQRNPFLFLAEPRVLSPVVTLPASVDAQTRMKHERTAAIEQAAGRMRLRSVLMGREPLATIDNRVVRVGDTITADNFEFRVVSIEGETVRIVAEDPALDVRVESTLRLRRDR